MLQLLPELPRPVGAEDVDAAQSGTGSSPRRLKPDAGGAGGLVAGLDDPLAHLGVRTGRRGRRNAPPAAEHVLEFVLAVHDLALELHRRGNSVRRAWLQVWLPIVMPSSASSAQLRLAISSARRGSRGVCIQSLRAAGAPRHREQRGRQARASSIGSGVLAARRRSRRRRSRARRRSGRAFLPRHVVEHVVEAGAAVTGVRRATPSARAKSSGGVQKRCSCADSGRSTWWYMRMRARLIATTRSTSSDVHLACAVVHRVDADLASVAAPARMQVAADLAPPARLGRMQPGDVDAPLRRGRAPASACASRGRPGRCR